MANFITSLCNTLTSCWNPRTAQDNTGINIEAAPGKLKHAPQLGPVGERRVKVEKPTGDIGEDPGDFDLEDSFEVPSDEENPGIEFRDQTSGFGGATRMALRDGGDLKQGQFSNGLSRHSSAAVSETDSDEPLVRIPAGANDVEALKQSVEKRTEEMYQILSEAAESWHNRINKTEVAREMWSLNSRLIDRLPYTPGERHGADGGSDSEHIPQYLVYHNRQIGQDEMLGTLAYWIKTLGDHVCVFPHLLPFYYEESDLQFLNHARRIFYNFVEAASRERKPSLALINMWGRWMVLATDFRNGEQAYYICDVVTSITQVRWEALAEDYIRTIRFLSCGRIKESNTTYLGNCMHGHISHANGPLACWLLEQLAEELKKEPGPIDDLINRCYAAWQVNVAEKGMHSDFDRRWRAKIFARLGA